MRMCHCSLKPVLFAVFNNWRRKIGVVILCVGILSVVFICLMNYNKEIAKVEAVFRFDELFHFVGFWYAEAPASCIVFFRPSTLVYTAEGCRLLCLPQPVHVASCRRGLLLGSAG